MKIKLSSYEIHQAITDYLEKNGINVTDAYIETFITHTVTKTSDRKKKLKTPKKTEFFMYTYGETYNDEIIEIEVFIEKDHS